jgi:hypothetical protein
VRIRVDKLRARGVVVREGEADIAIVIEKARAANSLRALTGEERNSSRSRRARDGHRFESPQLHQEVRANRLISWSEASLTIGLDWSRADFMSSDGPSARRPPISIDMAGLRRSTTSSATRSSSMVATALSHRGSYQMPRAAPESTRREDASFLATVSRCSTLQSQAAASHISRRGS